MIFFQKNHRVLFYSSWLILALIQSASTELIADEAYYWVYSKFPAWGYFDHPPMIAVLIKTGYLIFHNELGVRLAGACFSTFTILIVESLTEKKNPFLFYPIVLSIGVLQIAGFMAVPDTPLLFFTAVFFYTYRLYEKKTNWLNAVLLAITIALLFYTKYHGLLIVVFTFFSNLKLLRRRQTWLAVFLVLLFYSPHLVWQWQHDWVSFRYHLFESNVSGYKISYTIEYVLGQLLLAGPLAGFILLPAAFMYRSTNQHEKALKFVLMGIYTIFLISSFRGKVEANWTMPVLIPLVVLSHQFILGRVTWIKPLRIIAFISLLLIVAGRIYLAVDIGPDNSLKDRFHHNKAWVKTVAGKTADIPVVFYNSYQRSSLFWFYSGKPSHSHNAYTERRSNYNFWPTESNLLGKPVFIADVYDMDKFSDSVKTQIGWIGFMADPLYSALGQIKIIPDKTVLHPIATNPDIISLTITAQIPSSYSSFIRSQAHIPTELVAGIFNGKELVTEFHLNISAQQIAGWKEPYRIELPLNNIPRNKVRELKFGIRSKNYAPTHNSDKITLSGF